GGEGVVGACHQHDARQTIGEARREPAGHLEDHVLFEHPADTGSAVVAPTVPRIEDHDRQRGQRQTGRGGRRGRRGRGAGCTRGRFGHPRVLGRRRCRGWFGGSQSGDRRGGRPRGGGPWGGGGGRGGGGPRGARRGWGR